MPFTARRDPELEPDAIRAAHARLHPAFRDSPQYVHEGLSAATGAEVVLKVETVNPIRAFTPDQIALVGEVLQLL